MCVGEGAVQVPDLSSKRVDRLPERIATEIGRAWAPSSTTIEKFSVRATSALLLSSSVRSTKAGREPAMRHAYCFGTRRTSGRYQTSRAGNTKIV